MSKRSYRKIVVGGIEYTWIYGQHHIVIRRDGAVVAKTTDTEVSGWTNDEIDRGTYKGYFHLTPKHIADWIALNVDA
jgi:hypothetical protein